MNENSFAPTPGALDEFVAGVHRGGSQAYTEYRGGAELRERVAERLATFTGRSLSGANELIITPGTQGALFLALGATVNVGDRVAIVRPDYFANRKLVEFLGGVVVPVRMDYLSRADDAGLDLEQLESAFSSGVKTFLFSNPNNPTGVVYSSKEIARIAELAMKYGVTVIVDQLYSRLLYSNNSYTHLRAASIDASHVVTIMGPSKTESLSGYRLGVAFGAAHIVDRMEKLQAIVSLRAPGYSAGGVAHLVCRTRWLVAGTHRSARSSCAMTCSRCLPRFQGCQCAHRKRAAISFRGCRNSMYRCIRLCEHCVRKPASQLRRAPNSVPILLTAFVSTFRRITKRQCRRRRALQHWLTGTRREQITLANELQNFRKSFEVHAMTRKAFTSDTAPLPAGSYNIAVEAGGLVFLAGQTPRDRDNVRHGDKPFAFQARMTLE